MNADSHQRQRRAAGAAVKLGYTILAFAGIGLGTGEVALRLHIDTLVERLQTKVESLSNYTMGRFRKDESKIGKLASQINRQYEIDQAQSDLLDKILEKQIYKYRLQQERDNLQDAQISQNHQMALRLQGILIDITTTIEKQATIELLVDKLVLNTLAESTGIPIFNRSQAYLMKLTSGALHLKVIAKKMNNISNYSAEAIDLANQARRLRKLTNTTHMEMTDLMEKFQNVSNYTHNPLNMSNLYEDDFAWTDINMETGGLDKVLQTILGTGSDVVTGIGNGLESLFNTGLGILKPILTYLIPIALGVGILMLLIVILKFKVCIPHDTGTRKPITEMLLEHFPDVAGKIPDNTDSDSEGEKGKSNASQIELWHDSAKVDDNDAPKKRLYFDLGP